MRGHPKGWKFPAGYSPKNKTNIDEVWLLHQAQFMSSNDLAKTLGINGRTIRRRLTKLGFDMSKNGSKFNIGISRSPETTFAGSRPNPSNKTGAKPGWTHPPHSKARLRKEKHWLWKGGIRKGRIGFFSTDYKEWRKTVFERDDYTCQICKIRGGILHADHLKRWKDHPNSRYDVNNGRTLCAICHRGTPTYGNRKQLGGGLTC